MMSKNPLKVGTRVKACGIETVITEVRYCYPSGYVTYYTKGHPFFHWRGELQPIEQAMYIADKSMIVMEG